MSSSLYLQDRHTCRMIIDRPFMLRRMPVNAVMLTASTKTSRLDHVGDERDQARGRNVRWQSSSGKIVANTLMSSDLGVGACSQSISRLAFPIIAIRFS